MMCSTLSVTNHFSSLMDEHNQSSDEGLSPVVSKELDKSSMASSRALGEQRGRC